MLTSVYRAIRLDVIGLLPDVSDPHLLDNRYVRPQEGWQRLTHRSRLARIVLFFKRLIASLRPSNDALPESTGTVLFVVLTTNQWRALERVHAKFQENGIPVTVFDGKRKGGALRRLARSSYLSSLPFLPVVLMRMLRARGYAWRSFLWGFDRYWLAYGAYITVCRWFRAHRPSTVVVANDHSFWARVILASARDEGIPTVYIPHAPVTNRFPPLGMDFALLDGKHTLTRYIEAGASKTKVYLVGAPRFDAYLPHVNTNHIARTIAICIGRNDSQDSAKELLTCLLDNCSRLQYCLRLHPGTPKERVKDWKQFCSSRGVAFSDSASEHPMRFLSKVDVVIAGGSGIILEAALMNVTPLMYAMTPDRPDWYGFAQDGLCPLFSSPQQVAQRIEELSQHRPSVQTHAKKYCATIGTAFEGRSSELCATMLQQISECGDVDATAWKTVKSSSKICAFELDSDWVPSSQASVAMH